MTPEQAAEEYASTIQVSWPIANNGVASAITLLQLQAIQKQAFLAGHAHALRPRKIDPNDESTWPPFETVIIAYYINGAYGFRVVLDKDNLLNVLMVYAPIITHWLLAPPAPQEG